MTFSKLKYCRSLAKESVELYNLKIRELGKSRRNYKKIKLLEQTEEEVNEEKEKIAAEVESWISQATMHSDFQSEMRNFFIFGVNISSKNKNFHRDVLTLLGENKYYKKHDKKPSEME